MAIETKGSIMVRVSRPSCHTLPRPALRLPLLAVDKLTSGPALHEELRKATGQRTVPYVYIGGRLVGGCDATKALIASGEFDKLLGGGAGAGANGVGGGSGGIDHAALQVRLERLRRWLLCCCTSRLPLSMLPGDCPVPSCQPDTRLKATSYLAEPPLLCLPAFLPAGCRLSPGFLCPRRLRLCGGSHSPRCAALHPGPSAEENHERLL